MAATVNDRDSLIMGSTRTQPVTLPSDINVSGNVTGTLNGTPVGTVISNAATGANHAGLTGNVHNVSLSQISGDLDNIANGSTYFRTTQNQVTGAGRAFNALDANNEYIKTLTSTKLAVVGVNPSTGWVGDANGIRMYQGGVLKVNIPVSGSPSFSGDITGGSNIDITGRGVFSGNYTTSSVSAAVHANFGSNATNGVIGVAGGTNGNGVYGIANGNSRVAVYGEGQTASAIGVYARNLSGGTALQVSGFMTMTSTATVGNLSADMVDGFHASGLCSIIGCNSGSAVVSGNGFNLSVTVSGIQSRGTDNYVYIENTSDQRLKTDIKKEQFGLEFIRKLKPVTYRWKERPDIKYHGFIAQHVRPLIDGDDDSLFITHDNGIHGVDYMSLISPLVKAVQELNFEIEALKEHK